ncbi:MAG: hypothetical protein GF346_08225 [Candidatus Eisenbacteria bacterium]|nr:hypothetical protein [Candidatus Latescibacterota bacterium]MBD3302419.1 hypothetical protein [Candidatus Eisenbacteria bacterium]
MEPIAKQELNELFQHRGPCVTIYLPTHRKGPEVQQNPIRLKNLLRKAEEKLLAMPMRPSDAEPLLKPAQALISDVHFWRHQADGLAVFLGSGLTRYVRATEPFEELVVASERFHLKPLLRSLSGDGRFFVLAASKNSLRLIEGTRESAREIELEDVPRSLADAMKYEDPEKQLQFRTTTSHQGGPRPALFHSHGGGTDDAERKKEIVRYFHQVDDGIREFLKEGRDPLVFAGVDYLFPLYREANSYPALLDQPVLGSPDELSAEDLHRKAWEIVRPHFQRRREEASDLLRERAGTGRTADSIEEVVVAARRGRVDSLFVAVGERIWGSLDEEKEEVALNGEPSPGDEDLLDRAAMETIRHGGQVYALKREEMPLDRSVAAVFRY